MNNITHNTLHTGPEMARKIQLHIRESNKSYTHNKQLKIFNQETIRAGVHGGLPFDSLVTDVVSGCLPNSIACYGMCFAAISAWNQNCDFGKRVNNILDKELLSRDLEKLPDTQRYIRCGWNSDPSWNWSTSAEIASLAKLRGLLTIFITKAFSLIDKQSAGILIAAKAEMRVSISAMDSNQDLDKRLVFINQYRDAGGICIPIILTTAFKSIELQERQENIVNWMVKNDFPAAENSLRFPVDSLMVDLVDKHLMRAHGDGSDIWSGRLFSDRLLMPTTTTIPDSYSGIETAFLSKLGLDRIKEIFIEPVSTHDEVLGSGQALYKPKMCGVSTSYR